MKRYLFEAGTSFVTRLFDNGKHLACSMLGIVEVCATLARRQKSGDLSGYDFMRLTAQARRDWQLFYQVPLSAPVLNSAVTLAQNEALRGMDAIHLASAIFLNAIQNDQDFALVGSDAELNTAARRLGLRVINPVDEA
jgi:predicted nucleic acid-binding protein